MADLELNRVYLWDCIETMKTRPDSCVDSIVTDPPYEIWFMWKRRDNTGIANNVDMWRECLRVLKPWGHLLSFAATRTYHRMTCTIEDAGFEIRDMIEWVYGSGFPKSLNIAKAIDKMEGVEYPKNIPISDNSSMSGSNYSRNKIDVQSNLAKQYKDWGTALKPAHEPICMARKPLEKWLTIAENCLKWGTGGINIDISRVGTEEISVHNAPKGTFAGGEMGRGSDTESYRSHIGRFPANLITDGSEEVRECFPDTWKGNGKGVYNYAGVEYDNKETSMFNWDKPQAPSNFNDSGSASRFFKSIIYQAKASKTERNKGCESLDKEVKWLNFGGELDGSGKPINIWTNKNFHPTVKPIALMEYLIKMVTPKGGIVLDPFAGSGSTLVAAKQNWFQYIGCELTEEYIPIIEARLNAVE